MLTYKPDTFRYTMVPSSFETLTHVLYKPKLHRFIKDQQLMNFDGEEHHAWTLQRNVLSLTVIVLTKTVFCDFCCACNCC
jgi:hypothetical protein